MAADAETGVDANEHRTPATETTPLLQTRPGVAAAAFRNGTSPALFWAIFSQVLIVQFLVCFDATITVSSHPVITSYFGAARSASWLSTAFLLTSTTFQPVLGRLSDSLGRKPVLMWCQIVFALATTWCALAGSINSFIAARAFCGLGAGGLMTLGNIITSDLVPIERRGLYQPYSNIIYGLGSALGAALGGVMAEALGWRWEFGVQVPVLAVCFFVSLLIIPNDIGLEGSSKPVWVAFKEFDVKGSILLSTSTTGLILGLNLGGNVLPWSHPLVISSFSVFAACMPVFIWVESRVSHPLMPLSLILHKPRANLLFSNFIAAMLVNSILFNMPIFFRAVLLTTATSSGLRLMVPAIISSITSAVAGIIITRTRRLLWPVWAGTVLFILGLLPLCLFLTPRLPTLPSYLILIPAGLAQGFAYTGSLLALLATSDQSEQAAVISTLLLFRNLGIVFGIAASSLVVRNALLHYLRVFVSGSRKEEVIGRVVASVEAVLELEAPYRAQVVQSYEEALRWTFVCCAVVAGVGVLFVVPVRLPRLGGGKKS